MRLIAMSRYGSGLDSPAIWVANYGLSGSFDSWVEMEGKLVTIMEIPGSRKASKHLQKQVVGMGQRGIPLLSHRKFILLLSALLGKINLPVWWRRDCAVSC